MDDLFPEARQMIRNHWEGDCVSTDMSCTYTFKTKEITLRKGTGPAVIQFLDATINEHWYGLPSPAHPFFETARWMSLLRKCPWLGTQSYFTKRGDYYRLHIHADINYGSEEIAQFRDWITPFVAGHKPKEYIGWYDFDGSAYCKRNNVYIKRKNPENSGYHPNL